MPLPPSVDTLLAEWRRLTESEAQAIEARAWDRVLQLQRAKADLPPALDAAVAGEATSSDPVAADRAARLRELFRLEQRNREAVDRCRRVAESDRGELERSRLQLRRLHRSFVGAPEAAWQTYS